MSRREKRVKLWNFEIFFVTKTVVSKHRFVENAVKIVVLTGDSLKNATKIVFFPSRGAPDNASGPGEAPK